MQLLRIFIYSRHNGVTSQKVYSMVRATGMEGRPWGYESQPAQISKSNNSKRLQPQRFFRVFIYFYTELFGVLMLRSEFPSQ
jgi:hypothetical protein